MRNIKFRLWDKNDNKMYYFPNKKYKCVYFDEKSWEFPSQVAQQFTGLKDKNGREIYEGDFLQGQDYESPVQVVFENGGFGLVYSNITLPLTECYSAPDKIIQMQVVGNIFDNPNLLRRHIEIYKIQIKYEY